MAETRASVFVPSSEISAPPTCNSDWVYVNIWEGDGKSKFIHSSATYRAPTNPPRIVKDVVLTEEQDGASGKQTAMPNCLCEAQKEGEAKL